MGAESYRSVTKYQEDTEQALSDLQQQIFAAGEYRYSEDAEAGDIDEAREFAAEDGTKSVLDIYGISDKPTMAHAAGLEALVQVHKTCRQPTVRLADEPHHPHPRHLERHEQQWLANRLAVGQRLR